MMNNQEIASIFFEIADILELKDVEWKPRAYRQAARSIDSLDQDVSSIYKKGGLKALEEIPGIGEGLGKKIIEFLETKKIKELEDLKKKVPNHLELLIKVPGIGPKKAKVLYDKLKIRSIKDLEDKAISGKISSLEGFGEESQKDILESIRLYRSKDAKVSYNKAKTISDKIISYMKKCSSVKNISVAGSIRRKRSLIKDIDILVSTKHPKDVIDHFLKLKSIKKILAKGDTKVSIILGSKIQVDLRILDVDEWGSGLLYFTGSKNYNIYLRKVAIKKGYKLSEYGLFDNSTKKKIAGKTEDSIFKKLGIDKTPPEKREI